jgi:hypothetical protein
LQRLHLGGNPSWNWDKGNHHGHANERGPAKDRVKESDSQSEVDRSIKPDKEKVTASGNVFQVRGHKIVQTA